MSASQGNNAQGEPRRIPNALPDMRVNSKPLDDDHPYVFKHAPPKPDHDPWEILLNPKLEADTVRCNAWKDEVQNLLIFAGLFSAVVTAFVVESYKLLQPAPNDAVVGLLFLIANSLNNTSLLPPSVNPAAITTPFSQTSSSVRINVFWFLSLLLSLTTVLIGTISLQWLREHQSYPNFSPKEKAAILHMRSEALNAWYVPLIFSALPLLLQGALVLFLAGLVEFSLPLGLKLIIPVSVFVGLTLLFLGATTALPTIQGLSFFLRHSYRHVPTPCPFKSPQAHVIRILSGYLLRSVSSIFPKSKCDIPKDFDRCDWMTLPLHRHPFFPFIYTIWHQKTWLTFDREWLSLRDACHLSILANDPRLFKHQETWSKFKAFPISDLTQCIIKTVKGNSTLKYTEAFLGATVCCFQEISASIWTDTSTAVEELLQSKVYHNRYFEQLYQKQSYSCSISDFLLYNGPYKIDGNDKSTTVLQIFNQDQIFLFLDLIDEIHSLPKIYQYQGEVWSYIMSNIHALPLLSIPTGSSTPLLPALLDTSTLISIYYGHPFGSERFAALADMLSAVFKSAAGDCVSEDQSLDLLCTHSQIAAVLGYFANWTNDYLRGAQKNRSETSSQQHLQSINAQYILIFKFVSNHLNDEISDSDRNSERDTPSVLFYLASIFVWELLNWTLAENALRDNKDSSFAQGLGSLLEALLKYRTRTSGQKNNLLETRFADMSYSLQKCRVVARFSTEWWDILCEIGRDIGFEAAEQGPAVTRGSEVDSRSDSSSQDEHKTANIITTPAALHFEVIASSPASNASAPDGDIVDHNAVSHGDLRPPSLTRAVSNSDDHDVDTKQQSISNSPAIANPVTVANEALDLVANPLLVHSAPSSPDLHANHPPDGNHAADRATIQVPSPSPSPSPTSPPPSGEVGTDPPDVGATIFGDEQAGIQAGGPHLAIEIGSPTGLEQNEVAEVTDSGEGAPEDQARSEDAVVHIDSPN